MPLSGEYAPSTSDWARKQAETYEASGGAEAGDLRGMPVIVLTSVGAKSGLLRKTALMRVEHDGEYAVVGSLGGAPQHPVWVFNLRKHPHVELQDGAEKHDYDARELEGGRGLQPVRGLPAQHRACHPGVPADSPVAVAGRAARDAGAAHPWPAVLISPRPDERRCARASPLRTIGPDAKRENRCISRRLRTIMDACVLPISPSTGSAAVRLSRR
jgi:F420H(2)-dependent quinone reductase